MWGKIGSQGTGWSPASLTSHNTQDPTNPQFSLEEADMVFAELKRRDLLEAVVYIDANHNMPVLGYKIPNHKAQQWIALTKKSGVLRLIVFPWMEAIWGKHSPALLAFLTAFALAVAAQLGKKTADVFWAKFISTDTKIEAPLDK